jgi:ABC-type amino acid transport substrate-binding protein
MLRVCFASESMTFTSACSANFRVPGSSPASFIESVATCDNGTEFCGYDVQLWEEIAADMGIHEGQDWLRVCVGAKASAFALEDMAEYEHAHIARNDSDETTRIDRLGSFRPARVCDILASGTAVNSERVDVLGLKFTHPILQSPIAALVYSPDRHLSMWDFFRPMTPRLWSVMLITILLVPVAVVGLELVLSEKNRYRYERWRWRGRLGVVHAFGEGIWESIGHFLHTHHFPVSSTPARVVVAAYAFLTLVFANTYLANLAAFTTIDRLMDATATFHDLWGTPVGVFAPFRKAIDDAFGFTTTIIAVDGGFWGDAVVQGLANGTYSAVMFYEHSLQYLVDRDSAVPLRILDERVRLTDTDFVFRRTFPDDAIRRGVDTAIIALRESGRLAELQQQFIPSNLSGNEANSGGSGRAMPVTFYPLAGAWILYGTAILCAFTLAFVRLWTAWTHPEDRAARALSVKTRVFKTVFSSTANARLMGCDRGAAPNMRRVDDGDGVLADCMLMLEDVRGKLEGTRDRIVDESIPPSS